MMINLKYKPFFIFLFFVSVLFAYNDVMAQPKNIWRTLGMIKFDMQMNEANEMAVRAPRTEPMIKAMEGDEVIVKGYIIPLSGKKGQNHFMFSAYPYENCFFCGKAGVESVMEVSTKDEIKIDYSDEAIYIKGTFHYLGFKPNDIMFSLTDAVQIDAPE